MRRREYAVFIAPSMIVMFGLLALPLLRTLQWSLQSVDYGQPGVWVGMQNYTSALTDPRFLKAIAFTIGITLATFIVVVLVAYVLAVLVNGLGRSRPLVLGTLLVSYVVPQVIGATMFGWLFNSSFGGVVNYLLHEVTGLEMLWLTDVWPNRLLLLLAIAWGLIPFAMLVILAGLQGVPDEIVEAAELDGVSTMQLHIRVIVPTIRGVLGFVSLILIMDVLRVFDQLIPLSPQAVQIGNESAMLYIYNVAFRDGGQNLGLGSAVNILLIVVIFILLLPFIRGTARDGAHS